METDDRPAVLHVDLRAIVANWRDLCARHVKPVGAVLKADAYGGISDDLPLSKDVALGVYSIQIQYPGVGGGGSFRVEEYKKPEFEVKVEAPKVPVMLGEKINASIEARYYFGAPVTSAIESVLFEFDGGVFCVGMSSAPGAGMAANRALLTNRLVA